jgi:hypothetical protein
MTDITKLTDQEKSVMLARAMGWKYKGSMLYDGSGEFDKWIEPQPPIPLMEKPKLNLYDPANMALARKVFRWAYDMDLWPGFPLKILVGKGGWEWGLDRILELSVEAGVIELAAG